MTSMLRILLSQQQQQHQKHNNKSTQTQTYVTTSLDNVTQLVYRLLEKDKMQLLQSILVNLKVQQEKLLSKQGLVKKVKMEGLIRDSNMVISYSQLLKRLRLQEVVDNDNGENMSNSNKSIIKAVDFFVDYVFVERRITQQEIVVLENFIQSLKKEGNQQQLQKEQQQKLINKCQLLIRLAKQHQNQLKQGVKNDNNIENNNNDIENKQHQQKYDTAIQGINIVQLMNKQLTKQRLQQLMTQIGEGINTGFISDDFILCDNNKESKQILSLIELYNNMMNQAQSIMTTKKENISQQQQQQSMMTINNNNQVVSIKMNILPQLLSLLTIDKNNSQQSIKQLIDQIQDVINNNNKDKNEQQQQQHFNINKQLVYWNKYWLTVCFVQQLLRLAWLKYQQLLLPTTQQLGDNNKQQQSSYQTILSYIGQLYSQILTNIYTEYLQEGLQNDIKNNLYLSQQKLLTHYINLYVMSNLWLYSSNNTIQHSRIQQQVQFMRTKQFYITQQKFKYKPQSNNSNNYNNSKDLYLLLKSINQKITNIIGFFSYQRQGTENRLLSSQEYDDKIGKVLDQCGIKIDENVFMRWFVDGYDWYKNSQQEDNDKEQISSQLQQQKKQPIPLINKPKQLFIQKTYPLLQQLVCHHLTYSTVQQPLNQLIKTIMGIKLNTIKSVSKKFNVPQQNESFLSQLFEFHSPTFNKQYLTFNYIYGEMKDVYFYQNHHYSHVVISVYQVLMREFTKRLKYGREYQQRCDNNNNDNNDSDDNNDNSKEQQQQNSDNDSFQTRQLHRNNYANQQLAQQIFNKLRNHLGRYAKDHLLQANSKQFYQYVNLFKFCYVTFNKIILNLIDLDELVLTFDLLLNEIIVKQNHPLIRQYIEVIMARVYFVIKSKCIENNRIEKFCQCRNRMINMLDYDQENVHNLNIGVPILMLLGYQLVEYVEGSENGVVLNEKKSDKKQGQLKQQQQQKQIEDEFGSKQIKPQHELDIHYILVKYISCHVAYMRTICQYYMSKYIKLMKDQNQDVLLQNLVNFWHSDKDSVKIMNNISIAIQGFKNQMNLFNNSQAINESFYLCFERVEEQPKINAQYFLAIDTIEMLQRLSNISGLSNDYAVKVLFAEKILQLKSQVKGLRNKMIELLVPQKEVKSEPKKVQKTKENTKKVKPQRQDKKGTTKQLIKQKLQQKQKAIKQQNLQKFELNQQQLEQKLNQNLTKSYLTYQRTNQPNVVIIATLLQKVHNFGYLVRTLTSHNAMLTVPSSQPFTHPQCKELLPKQDEIDVKVIEVKQRHLESFIKMYQQRGYPLIALQQCSKSITLQKTVFPQKYMLLLGNQRIGAPASLLNMADILVQIPQIGKIRSLNVHVSMVICFWEYLKQQKEKNNKPIQNK